MSFRRSIREIGENLGSGTADFADKVGEGVRGFACDIWYNFPDYVTNSSFITNSIARGFMQDLCKDKNLPPAPAPPFTGGQCESAVYGIQYQTAVIQNGTFSSWSATSNYTSVQIVGAVKEAQMYANNVAVPFEHWSWQGAGVPPTFGDRTRPYKIVLVDSVGTKTANLSAGASGVKFVKFYRIDGQPDDCGDLPTTYPPSNPPLPPTKSISIDVDADTTIDVPIEVVLNANGTFNFPFTFKVGDLNNTFYVKLDLGGFEFNYDVDLPDSTEPPVAPPPVAPPPKLPPGGGGGGGGGGSSSPTNEIPPPPEKEPQDSIVNVLGGLAEDNVEGLIYLTITIDNVPANSKKEYGYPGDDVHYPGFVVFRSGGNNLLPRYPLHYVKNRIKPLPGTDGYAIRLYEGFSATVIKTLLIKE